MLILTQTQTNQNHTSTSGIRNDESFYDPRQVTYIFHFGKKFFLTQQYKYKPRQNVPYAHNEFNQTGSLAKKCLSYFEHH